MNKLQPPTPPQPGFPAPPKVTPKPSFVKGLLLLTIGVILLSVVISPMIHHGVTTDTYAPGPGSVALSGTQTEQNLCAALVNGTSWDRLPGLVNAVSNDAESGILLSLEGASLEMHLSMTNNGAKVQEDINDMLDTCSSQAG